MRQYLGRQCWNDTYLRSQLFGELMNVQASWLQGAEALKLMVSLARLIVVVRALPGLQCSNQAVQVFILLCLRIVFVEAGQHRHEPRVHLHLGHQGWGPPPRHVVALVVDKLIEPAPQLEPALGTAVGLAVGQLGKHLLQVGQPPGRDNGRPAALCRQLQPAAALVPRVGRFAADERRAADRLIEAQQAVVPAEMSEQEVLFQRDKVAHGTGQRVFDVALASLPRLDFCSEASLKVAVNVAHPVSHFISFASVKVAGIFVAFASRVQSTENKIVFF